MLRVISCCSHVEGGFVDMVKSLKKGGFNYRIHVGDDEEGWSWRRKTMFQLQMCEEYANDIILFIDAFDCLFLGTEKELLESYREAVKWYRSELLYCGDKDAHPIRAAAPCYYLKDEELLTSDARWPYVNSGGIIGPAWVYKKTIQWGMKNYPIDCRENDTDQRFWTQCFFNGFGDVDRKCMVFQNIWNIQPDEYGMKNGRLKNLITGTWPQVIHASGKSWNAIPDELKP